MDETVVKPAGCSPGRPGLCYNGAMNVDEMSAAVRGALEPFPCIAFAYLFGSAVAQRLRLDSDVDVAVYLDSGRRLQIESERREEVEADIQLALERATNRNVDLLVLNRAPASVCAAVVLDGIAVLIRDQSIHSRYFLAVTNVAMDFRDTAREYRVIRARSRSLSESDRARLERILDFIEQELDDRHKFTDVGLHRYSRDRDLQRNLDRWVEQLINAAIDTAKIILASERRPVPQTYAQILSELEAIDAFASMRRSLKPLAALRNLMAHEYLDVRFDRVRDFVLADVDAVARMADIVRGRWLS